MLFLFLGNRFSSLITLMSWNKIWRSKGFVFTPMTLSRKQKKSFRTANRIARLIYFIDKWSIRGLKQTKQQDRTNYLEPDIYSHGNLAPKEATVFLMNLFFFGRPATKKRPSSVFTWNRLKIRKKEWCI